MNPLPDDWRKVRVPLQWAFALVVAVVGGFLWVKSNLVFAEDFKQTIRSIETRGIERDRQQYEIKLIELKAKKKVTPKAFTGVDAVMLEEYEKKIKQAEEELREVRRNAR